MAAEPNARALNCVECKKPCQDKPHTVKGRDKDGNVTRVICSDCNGLKKRIFDLSQMEDAPEGFAMVKGDERAQFMADCAGLYGTDLLNKMQEWTTNKTSKSRETQDGEYGDAMPVCIAAELPQFVRGPAALERLCSQPSMTFECKHSGMQMVYVPVYKYQDVNKRLDQDEQIRETSGEAKLKKSKPQRAPRDPKSDAPKPMPEALKKKVDKAVQEIDAWLHAAAGPLMYAKVDSDNSYVPAHLVTKVESIGTELEEMKGKFNEAVDQKMERGHVLNLFEQSKLIGSRHQD
ncbi:unnamed protein product, partial [Prorocentrum cordatum]